MRVLVATDAWHPQINGVVRTLAAVAKAAAEMGAEFRFITPQDFPTLPLPGYSEIALALPTPRRIARMIAAGEPDAIHIATEGPIGCLVRRHCLANGLPFTTSFHTRLPDYISARLPIPRSWSWNWLCRFHNAGRGIMTSTPALASELQDFGFRKTLHWPRGVDTELFRPRPGADLHLPRPVFLNVGRLAVEKNVAAFLSLDLPGSKVVVGDGPAREALQRKYPKATFLGALEGEALAFAYAAADVFVFPSKTDTFGLVLLEALASGVPVAAYPVAGPRDVIGAAPAGVLAEDLRAAALFAQRVPREACRAFALRHRWQESARMFLENLAPIRDVPEIPARVTSDDEPSSLAA